MFYQGTLQDGIALAVTEQRLVACFVHGDDDESCTWEADWLESAIQHDDIPEITLGILLGQRAVLLKIKAGSTEASQLAAFCTLDTLPRLIVIDNGSVVADIRSGTTRDDFVQNVLSAIRSRDTAFSRGVEADSPTHVHADTATDTEPIVQPAVPVASPNAPTDARIRNEAQIQRMLTERGERLEQERLKRERAEKEARRKAAEEKKLAEAANQPPSVVEKSRRDWLEQQAKRKKEAKADKERVLRLIEADKQERRHREEQRRLIAQGDSEPAAMSENVTSRISASSRPSASSSETCALQIRLYDGTSIRSHFDHGANLADAVRTYITAETTTDIPYDFRLLQTPQPSRTINVAEESQSLQALGLTPSATLVLVPVKGYTNAYAASSSGYIARVFALSYSILAGACGLVGGVVGRLTGLGTPGGETNMAAAADEDNSSSIEGSKTAGSLTPSGSSSVNIRTLADQRERPESHELYNGNQLNFEPQKDDEEERK